MAQVALIALLDDTDVATANTRRFSDLAVAQGAKCVETTDDRDLDRGLYRHAVTWDRRRADCVVALRRLSAPNLATELAIDLEALKYPISVFCMSGRHADGADFVATPERAHALIGKAQTPWSKATPAGALRVARDHARRSADIVFGMTSQGTLLVPVGSHIACARASLPSLSVVEALEIAASAIFERPIPLVSVIGSSTSGSNLIDLEAFRAAMSLTIALARAFRPQ